MTDKIGRKNVRHDESYRAWDFLKSPIQSTEKAKPMKHVESKFKNGFFRRAKEEIQPEKVRMQSEAKKEERMTKTLEKRKHLLAKIHESTLFNQNPKSEDNQDVKQSPNQSHKARGEERWAAQFNREHHIRQLHGQNRFHIVDDDEALRKRRDQYEKIKQTIKRPYAPTNEEKDDSSSVQSSSSSHPISIGSGPLLPPLSVKQHPSSPSATSSSSTPSSMAAGRLSSPNHQSGTRPQRRYNIITGVFCSS
eukprot:TRINITY_DN5018_c0_g1_i1.p1 TRINITY_DN5018_c0_g1~~TRINITY_DN5018_c0_g1_i1.p1  ORF type:complete len:250 (-),score=45.28 TRINITY_DN5018_c0_g1_i1:216-965(-)